MKLLPALIIPCGSVAPWRSCDAGGRAADVPLPRPRPDSRPPALSRRRRRSRRKRPSPRSRPPPSACRLRLTPNWRSRRRCRVVGPGECGADDVVRLEAVVLRRQNARGDDAAGDRCAASWRRPSRNGCARTWRRLRAPRRAAQRASTITLPTIAAAATGSSAPSSPSTARPMRSTSARSSLPTAPGRSDRSASRPRIFARACARAPARVS